MIVEQLYCRANMSVVLDKSVESRLQNYVEQCNKHPKVPTIGIIIGHVSGEAYTVVHLAPCPKPEPLISNVVEISDDESSDIKEYGGHQKGSSAGRKSSQKTRLPELKEYIDEEWIYSHCEKLYRNLPGGLDMLGVFFIGEKKAYLELHTALLKGVKSIRALGCGLVSGFLGKESAVTHLLLLNLEIPAFRKPTMSLVNVASGGGLIASPCSFTYQATKWLDVSTRVVLDLSSYQSKRSSHYKLEPGDQFESLFKKSILTFCQSLWSHSNIAIENRVWSPDITISNMLEIVQPENCTDRDATKSGKKRKQRGKGKSHQLAEEEDSVSDNPALTVEFYVDETKLADSESVQRRSCGLSWSLHGTLACLAQVPIKNSTAEDIASALCSDVIRSLLARAHLHAEGMQIVEEDAYDQDMEEQRTALHQLPKRVFASVNLSQGKMHICDYLFEGDRKEDACETFRDVLGLEVEEDCILAKEESLLSLQVLQDLGLVTPSEASEHSSKSSIPEFFSPAANECPDVSIWSSLKDGDATVYFSVAVLVAFFAVGVLMIVTFR